MNRSYVVKKPINPTDTKELLRKTAVHEAGHAAGIYFGNQTRQLPPVHFQIVIQRAASKQFSRSGNNTITPDAFAKIEGGRLLQCLPSTFAEAAKDFTPAQTLAYRNAFEADMVNHLIGPLAEANYVALRDDELFNPHLVNLQALENYGGHYDLAVVDEYLQCLISDESLRQQKIDELFLAACHFVSDRAYWFAITALANFILADNKTVIDCEEAIAVMQTGFAAAQKKVWHY